MRKVLIFGGSGFIGSNIEESMLTDDKFEITAPSSNACDLKSVDNIEKVFQEAQPDIVINAVFKGVSVIEPFSNDYILENIALVKNILEACSRQESIKKIIHFGSCVEYGDSDNRISEDATLQPKNIYGTTKAITTLSALQLARELELPLVIIRPFYLYGSHDDKSVLYYLMNSLLNNKQFELTLGEQKRDYLYIKDFAKIIQEICISPDKFIDGEIYNLGSGEGVQLSDVFTEIFNAFGSKPEYKVKDYSKFEYFSQIADMDKMNNLVSLDRHTPLREGVLETLEWVKRSKPIAI